MSLGIFAAAVQKVSRWTGVTGNTLSGVVFKTIKRQKFIICFLNSLIESYLPKPNL